MPAPAPTVSFILAGLWRRSLGAVLLATAATFIMVGSRLDWGTAATCVIPGLLLLPPASALLLGRSRLHACDGQLLLASGAVTLADVEIEMAPTAGLVTVLLHQRGGRPVLLGSWLTPRRAADLLAWLDDQAGAPLPRRQSARPEWDR